MKNVGLIGFGRFGNLLFNHLKQIVEFKIFDPIQESRIQKSSKTIPFASLKEVLQQETIILAVPVSQIENVTKEIASELTSENLVVDVCAVKTYPINLFKKYFSREVNVLGTHPLFGPDSAAESLSGHKMIISPVHISPDRLSKFKKLWESLGVEIVQMSPEEHDRLMAWTLALTHFLGRGLSRLPLPQTSVSTRDYQNLLALIEKINRDTYELFQDIHRYNPYTKEMRTQLLESLKILKDELDKL